MRLSFVATLVAAVSASPLAPELIERGHGNAFCAGVSKAVLAGGYQSVATSFCSSYAVSTVTTTVATTSVGTTTTTITTGTTTVPGPASTTTTVTTTTSTHTSTVTDTSTTTTGTSTTSTTVTTTCGLPPGFVAPVVSNVPLVSKRAHHAPTPACFKGYTAPAALSSACSCLHISPSTSTSTIGLTTTSVSTVTVSTVATSTSTPTSTVTSTATTDTTTITTTTSIASVLATSTVTSTTATSPTSFYVYATPVGLYGKLESDGDDSPTAFTEATDATADIYSLTAGDGFIESDTGSPGYFGEQDSGGNPEAIFFYDLNDLTYDGYERVPCTITNAGDGSCPLFCTAPFDGGTVQSLTYYREWDLGQSSAGTVFTPLVIDAGGS